MTDAYKIALNEFKEASAAVRHAFAVQMEARAAQITANREYMTATDAHTAASERLAKADDALMMVKDKPETAFAIIDAQTCEPVSFKTSFAIDGVEFVPNGAGE
jgi:hypothetical protein